MSSREVVIPESVFAVARDTLGAFFEPISRTDRVTSARDFLDTSKSSKRAELLQRYAVLQGSRVLEIGSGFGTNVAVWTAEFAIDGYGVEPSSLGFDGGYAASKELLTANGIDPARIIDAVGERLPFPDQSFDIVYSANVLEHTTEPERVLSEAIRTLRPGGILHMEIPNHLSYFEGHYMVLQPPIIQRWMLPAWVSLLGRDPAFSKTLQTQINPAWCRRVLRTIGKTYPLDILTLGEDIFLERLARRFEFETQAVSYRLATAIRCLQFVNRWNWIGKLIVALHGYYPLYVTVRRR